MQAYWITAAFSAGVAGAATIAERRRARRADINRVGWVPWPAVLLAALFVAAVSVALALKG